MAAVVRNTIFVAKRVASTFALINQPLTFKRCFTKSRVEVAAQSLAPAVLDAVIADATTSTWSAVFRYAGAKPWSRKVLQKHLPDGCSRVLFPCGGSASDAFGYRDLFKKMVVADANADVINVHHCAVNRTEELIAACEALFKGNNNEQAYNRVRDDFRTGKGDDLTRAAQYIYLQQHNKSGISRYSKKSGYNASFAKDEKRKGAPADAIRAFAKVMPGVDFVHADMLATLAEAGKGDVVLLDPPYRPAEGKKITHTNYTRGGFPLDSYKSMVKSVEAATRRGAVVFVHDHDTAETRSLHANCSESLPVLVKRKTGKQQEMVAEAVFIYRPETVAQVIATPEIAVARTFGFKLKHAFRFIDLFAGIGGFHLGMKQKGGHCVLACEKDKEARKTYRANHDMDGVPFPDDITTLDAADVPDHEVLCAGFPCQAFSIAGGKEGFNDVRGELVFHMLRIIEAKRPLVFVGENVKHFLNGGNGEWHRTLCDRLDSLGYTVISNVLNAAHFGTAQERERVFFVAYRRNAFPNVKTFHMPRGDGQWISVADILEPNAPAGHRDIKDMVPAPTINKKSPFKRVGKMFGRRGQDARVYDPAGHAATLMASQQNCGLYLVDGTPRALTPRERARLQGFPDTFQPHPVMTHANKQFGNSVAVPVVAAIAEAIVNQLLQPASQKEATMKSISTAAPEITVIDSTRHKAGNTTSRKHATPKRDKFSNGILKPDTHGQVFTPATLVKDMLALRRNTGRVLEPSCGSGAFSNVLHAEGADLMGLELDREHAPAYAIVQDFFDLPESERFDTIIGNPPYLRYQDIPAATKAKLDMTNFDRRTNLFYFFIEKCVWHLAPGGELIFVVPREFPKATAARRLNRWLFEQGTVTDFSDIGDKVFDGATPACCVFRFEKSRTDRTMTDGRVFAEHDGQLLFLPAGTRGVPLAEFFTVAVGGLTGADELYTHPLGNLDVVCSTTHKNGKTRKVLHGAHAKLMLAPHKAKLLSRRVRTFNEANWWEWGRKWKESAARRIYVNAKTRQVSPFFSHEATAFDGSVLALFPCNPAMNVDLAVGILNNVDWDALGFVTGGRFLFAQRALERTLIPDAMAEQLRAAISQPVLQLAA